MVGLPSGHSATGAGLLLAGIAVALLLGVLARRRGARAGGPAARLSAVALGVAVAAAPFTAWRTIEGIRYSTALPAPIVRAFPAYHYNQRAEVFQEALRAIPRDATFYVKASQSIEPLAARAAFETWPVAAFLPRRAVADPRRASWILTWDVDPHRLGVRLASVRTLPSTYRDRPVYLARVAGR